MKELSVEEKATRYDEAIERAIVAYKDEDKHLKATLERIFPELKESEDEKIRKELLNYLYDVHDDDEERARWISWLEKQGGQKPTTPKFRVGDFIKLKDSDETYEVSKIEIFDTDEIYYHLTNGGCVGENADNFELVKQKPADKVEPKFKVGYWYQCTKDFFGKGVTFDKNTAYYCEKEGCLQNKYGCHMAIVKDLYDNFKLWDIFDAKDGDVLCCESGWTCIFKALDNHRNTFSSYCFMDKDKWFCNTGSECHTLDERFVKAYNGEISPATNEQRDTLFAKMKEEGYEWDAEKKELKKIEQKPAWSEEDEEMLENIICDINTARQYVYVKSKCDEETDWLKNLKDRVQPQPNQEWNEEDERLLNSIIDTLDEIDIRTNTDGEHEDHSEEVFWLKSLIPQPQWKPSDEQMVVLNDIIINGHLSNANERILKGLQEQLKKLKE